MINSYNAGMSTLAERLHLAMEKNPSLSKTGLWKACKLSSGAVSHWFSGGTKELKGDNLLKAAVYLGVNVDWLSSGNGEMYPKPVNNKEEEKEKKPKEQLVVAGKPIPKLHELMLTQYLELSGTSQNTIDMMVNRLHSLEHPTDLTSNPNNGKKKKEAAKQ